MHPHNAERRLHDGFDAQTGKGRPQVGGSPGLVASMVRGRFALALNSAFHAEDLGVLPGGGVASARPVRPFARHLLA